MVKIWIYRCFFLLATVFAGRCALADARMGFIDPSGNFIVKEGALDGTSWVVESGGVIQAALTPTRVGVLTSNGTLSVKEGDLSAGWVINESGVSKFALTGNRIGKLVNGTLSIREGLLNDPNATWVWQADNVAQFAMSDNRTVVLSTDGSLSLREGDITSADWQPLFGSGPGIIADIAASNLRIGYRTSGNEFCVFENQRPPAYATQAPLTGCPAGWTEELAFPGVLNAAQIALSDVRIAYLTTGGNLLVSEGKLGSAFMRLDTTIGPIPLNVPIQQIALSGLRIGFRNSAGWFVAYEGPLISAPIWIAESNSPSNTSTQIALGEFSAGFPSGPEQSNWIPCPNSDDEPDTPANAFRDASGQIQMISGSAPHNRRSIRPTLDTLQQNDCNVVMGSQLDPVYENHQYYEWIHGLYTPDGNTIYALVHNEYHGSDGSIQSYSHCPPPSNQWDPFSVCLKDTLSLAISTNGGVSYSHSTHPDNGSADDHSVAWLPYTYDQLIHPDSNNNPPLALGLAGPSNIILAQDGYYYATISAGNADFMGQMHGVCLIRTSNLNDVHSWEAWKGEDAGFQVAFYPNGNITGGTCTPILSDALPGAGMGATHLAYSTFLNQYILIGYTHFSHSQSDPGATPVFFFFSPDLVHWGPARKMEGLKWPTFSSSNPFNAYAAIFDKDDTSTNLDHPGSSVYLYYTHFNFGASSDAPNRILKFTPITFQSVSSYIVPATLKVSVTGSGTVTSNPLGINCPSLSPCSRDFAGPVTLAATPGSGYYFAGWSQGCSGTGICTVTMNGAIGVPQPTDPVQADFEPNILTVNFTGAGSGVVSLSGVFGGVAKYVSCSATCQTAFDAGSTVTLIEQAGSGNAFNPGWSTSWPGSGCSGPVNSCSGVLSSPQTVNVGFSAAAISVATPGTLQAGTQATISWIPSSAIASDHFRIDLLRGGRLYANIVASVAGTSYSWSIPSGQALSADYQIQVTDLYNPVIGTSGLFEISDSGIALTSVNTGILQRRTTVAITWIYSGSVGSTVNIDLLKEGVVIQPSPFIAGSVVIGSGGVGSYNWAVPANLQIGSGYSIRVTTSGASDQSHNFLIIR